MLVALFAIALSVVPPRPATADGGDTARGPLAKISSDMANLLDEYDAYLASPYGAAGGGGQGFLSGNPLLHMIEDRLIIDAVAEGDVGLLLADLETLGLQRAVTFGRVVSGQLPISAIDEMAALTLLRFARPAYYAIKAGLITSQGDVALRSNIARAGFGVSGAGVVVGVLSDSFDCLGGAAGDVASGDLPSGIVVLDDSVCAGTSDEGRAMMQLVHDVAPGAGQAFHTAAAGIAGFASAIVELATVAGANVIVDDIIYLNEPMFQDGVVAQAADTVAGLGVAFFSAAGNDGRDAYEGEFRPGPAFALDAFPIDTAFDPLFGAGAPRFFGGIAHDFDPGSGVDVLQAITVPNGTRFTVSFQWDQPFFRPVVAPAPPTSWTFTCSTPRAPT